MTILNPISNSRPDAIADVPREAQVLSFGELSESEVSGGRKLVDNINPLHQVRTRLSVNVGEIEMTVGELLATYEHQVLRLNRAIDQPVDLLLDGQVVARGQLVAVEEQFAVRITELPLPLKV